MHEEHEKELRKKLLQGEADPVSQSRPATWYHHL